MLLSHRARPISPKRQLLAYQAPPSSPIRAHDSDLLDKFREYIQERLNRKRLESVDIVLDIARNEEMTLQMLKTVPVKALVSRGTKLGAVIEVQGSLSKFKR